MLEQRVGSVKYLAIPHMHPKMQLPQRPRQFLQDDEYEVHLHRFVHEHLLHIRRRVLDQKRRNRERPFISIDTRQPELTVVHILLGESMFLDPEVDAQWRHSRRRVLDALLEHRCDRVNYITAKVVYSDRCMDEVMEPRHERREEVHVEAVRSEEQRGNLLLLLECCHCAVRPSVGLLNEWLPERLVDLSKCRCPGQVEVCKGGKGQEIERVEDTGAVDL